MRTYPHPRARVLSGDPTAASPACSALPPLPCLHTLPPLLQLSRPLRSSCSHLVGWLPVAGACLNLHRPGLGEAGAGSAAVWRGSSPGAQLWHLSRSDSNSGTSRLGPMAPLASLFLCSGAAATPPPTLLLSLPPLACLPHASAGRDCGLRAGGFCFPIFSELSPGRLVNPGQSCCVLNSRQRRCLPHDWDRFSASEAQPPPQRKHTCGQLPVSTGAPAAGISSCLHHPIRGGPHTHIPEPLRGPDVAHRMLALTYTHKRTPGIHVTKMVDTHGSEPINIQPPVNQCMCTHVHT